MRTGAAETLFSFYHACGNVHGQLTRRAEAVLPLGLTMPQFNVIDALRLQEGKLTPLELAVKFRLTKGAVTNLLGQLQRKGLITLANNPEDGRSKLVGLSGDGEVAHRACLIALSEFTSILLSEFDTDELGEVLPVLEKFTSWLEQE